MEHPSQWCSQRDNQLSWRKSRYVALVLIPRSPFLDFCIMKGLSSLFSGITLEEAVRIFETDSTIDIDIAVLEDLIKTNPIKSLSWIVVQFQLLKLMKNILMIKLQNWLPMTCLHNSENKTLARQLPEPWTRFET